MNRRVFIAGLISAAAVPTAAAPEVVCGIDGGGINGVSVVYKRDYSITPSGEIVCGKWYKYIDGVAYDAVDLNLRWPASMHSVRP